MSQPVFLHLAWDTLKSVRAFGVLLLTLMLIVDSEAFTIFSANTRSTLSEPGRLDIHLIAVEKMLNLDLVDRDLRGVVAPTCPCDPFTFHVLLRGVREVFWIFESVADDFSSLCTTSDLYSSGKLKNFSFKMFRFSTLFTINVPSLRNLENASFSKDVISCDMTKYWLKADLLRKLRSELSSSSICKHQHFRRKFAATVWQTLTLRNAMTDFFNFSSNNRCHITAPEYLFWFLWSGGFFRFFCCFSINMPSINIESYTHQKLVLDNSYFGHKLPHDALLFGQQVFEQFLSRLYSVQIADQIESLLGRL